MNMRNDRKSTPLSKNVSSRQLRSFIIATVNSTLFETFQKSFEISQELIDRSRKAQKRKHAVEDEHSQKRLRKDSSFVLILTAISQDLVDV